MITPGQLDLVGFRNADFVYAIAMPGLDLRGAVITAQVRGALDTTAATDDTGSPYPALTAFFISTGFSTTPDGLPYTSLTLSLGESVLRGLPKVGELGSPNRFAWDLIATPPNGFKSVYLRGAFILLPGVTYV